MKEGSLKRAGLLIGALTGNDHRYVHAVPNGSLQENYAIIRDRNWAQSRQTVFFDLDAIALSKN